jgi:hypothetical protein
MKLGAVGKTQSDTTFFMNFSKLFSECAEGNCVLLAHSPTALSELKPRISQEIIIQNEKKIRFILSRLYGKD